MDYRSKIDRLLEIRTDVNHHKISELDREETAVKERKSMSLVSKRYLYHNF